MKKLTSRLQILLIFVLLITFIQLPVANAKAPSNILVIYSQNFNFDWVEGLQKGISDALKTENLYFYNEYLNENILADKVSMEDSYNSMHAKYKNVKFDCVLVADNYAYNFMEKYYEKLVPNTPIIFVAVKDYSKKKAFTDMMTGIPHEGDINNLIKLVLSINDKDELIFISSQNATSSAGIRIAEIIMKKDYPNVKYQVLAKKNLDEILEKLAGVKHAQLIMIGSIIQADGVTLPSEKLSSKIFAATKLPLYTGNRLQINDGNSGAIGGVVVGPYEHGKAAGLMVKQIIDGVDVHEIPVKTTPLTETVFNYNMLKYFNIPESKLPADSIILGKPTNTVNISNEALIRIITGVFLLGLFVIVVLFKDRKLKQEIIKYNESQKELRESNNKFRTYIDKSPVGIFVVNGAGRYIDGNYMASQMSGFTKEELVKLSISDSLPPEELDRGIAAFSEIKAKGFAEGEYIVKKNGGENYWLSLAGVKIDENCIIAFCTDISERKAREARIQYISFHDAVTKAHNRTFLKKR